MQLHRNNHGGLFPFVFGLSLLSWALKQKSPLFASGPKSFNALELDDGHPHPVAPVRKSPRVAIEGERHVAESTDFHGKRKPDLAYRKHQRGY
jgi:hypothetical protein